MSFISSLELCTTVVVISTSTGPGSNRVLCASTPKYHATDKHDTPPGYMKLTLGQSDLLYAINGES